MKVQTIQTDLAPKAIGPYSQAVWAGEMLLMSGQIALDTTTGLMVNESIEMETHQVMKNIIGVLQAAGLTLSHVVKVSIFLIDMNDFAKINEIYASYLSEPYPARETVQVARLPRDARIEISMIAVK